LALDPRALGGDDAGEDHGRRGQRAGPDVLAQEDRRPHE
jgi:hypothetical protein